MGQRTMHKREAFRPNWLVSALNFGACFWVRQR
jgi:hypothetical protein